MKFFKEKELTCKCGARACRESGQLPPFARENMEALVENVLDPAREAYGKPIKVNSGYRCPKHNAEVGGAKQSQHVKGEAADICCADNKRLAEIIECNGKYDQLIIYPTFIHVSWKRSGLNRRVKLWGR